MFRVVHGWGWVRRVGAGCSGRGLGVQICHRLCGVGLGVRGCGWVCGVMSGCVGLQEDVWGEEWGNGVIHVAACMGLRLLLKGWDWVIKVNIHITSS